MALDLSQKAGKGILLLPESSGASPNTFLLPAFSCNVLNLWYLHYYVLQWGLGWMNLQIPEDHC